jgi:hypothetical protein
MAFSKALPLEERIKSICAEAEAVVEAKAVEIKKQYDGLPIAWIRRDPENRMGGCVCKQALAIIEEDGK